MSPQARDLPPDPLAAAGLLHAGRVLRRAGYDARAVTAFFGVPLVSDAHHVAPPAGRARRGLGGLIALFLGGEDVERADVSLLDDEALAALVEAGLLLRAGNRLRACASITPFVGGALVAADRLDQGGAAVVRAPDLSAWNVAACLPADRRPLVDAGCGAGAILLSAARRGVPSIGFDVDDRALRFAAVNRVLNEIPEGLVRLVHADVRDPPADTRTPGSIAVFNAPLLRAPLAGEAPLYLHAPGADELPRAFVKWSSAQPEGAEVLCHTQLDEPLWELAAMARFSSVLALEFARSPEGIPHALLSLRAGVDPCPPARLRTPLGPLLPHLHRELLDRLHATQALLAHGDLSPAPLRPAPWLALTRLEQHDGHAFRPRALRFGEAVLLPADEQLLRRCDGRAAGEVAVDGEERERLLELARRGLLVV